MQHLQTLFLNELADIYNAEKQLTKALPKMAKAAQSESLRDAFENHLTQTENQISRLEEVFELFGKPAKGRKCQAMEGLIAEGQELMAELKAKPSLDAGLICAAQKVEHYEIATYGCLCTWADLLGNKQALKLLKETLNEEETTDKSLSDLAESCINAEAEQEDSTSLANNNKRPAQRASTPAKMTSKRK